MQKILRWKYHLISGTETRYGNKVFTSLKTILVWNVKWFGKCMKSIVGFQVDGDNYGPLEICM